MNTTKAVIPHAFYGSNKEPHDKSIFQIPTETIMSDVRGHLEGYPVKSHFSSWAANFQTALGFASVGTDAHLAVFDTSLRGQHNEIYHVSALKETGLTSYHYPEEYLVYGPVTGEAYTCVSVMDLRQQGMTITEGPLNGTSKVTEKDLAHARKIASNFRPISHDLGPDLFLTVVAVELSRLLRSDRGHNHGSGWSQKDNREILTHLSDAVSLASKISPKKPLVNPKTYVHGFSQLKAMVDILMTVELEIDRKRSEVSKTSSSTKAVSPESAGSAKKRKSNDRQVSTDSKVVEAEPKKALPRDLIQDLSRHGDTFQAGLQDARKQLNSTDAKAQALKAKLVLTEKRLAVLSINPKRSTLNTTMLDMKKAASNLDGLTKRTQGFTTELQHVIMSLDVLQASCAEIIKSIGTEKDPFEPQDPQKSLDQSLAPQPLVPTKTKPVAEHDLGTQNRKRVKQTNQNGT